MIWRLIFALAHYGGLCVPSELLPPEWANIHWDKQLFIVRSPKTEHHDGKGLRLVPIFPELQRYLQDAFEQAESGQRYIVTRYRYTNQNLRTQLTRFI
ncbi:MAG: site-specific integrase [Planctomycetes bacterium]|nr:site-specific integrase [Planctomycetota bacterium]